MIKLIILLFTVILSFILYKFISSYSQKKKNFFLKICLIFIFFIISAALAFTVFTENNTNKTYIPAEFDGEKIKPGFFSD